MSMTDADVQKQIKHMMAFIEQVAELKGFKVHFGALKYTLCMMAFIEQVAEQKEIKVHFGALKYTFCVIVKFGMFLYTCTKLQKCVLHLGCKIC